MMLNILQHKLVLTELRRLRTIHWKQTQLVHKGIRKRLPEAVLLLVPHYFYCKTLLSTASFLLLWRAHVVFHQQGEKQSSFATFRFIIILCPTKDSLFSCQIHIAWSYRLQTAWTKRMLRSLCVRMHHIQHVKPILQLKRLSVPVSHKQY